MEDFFKYAMHHLSFCRRFVNFKHSQHCTIKNITGLVFICFIIRVFIVLQLRTSFVVQLPSNDPNKIGQKPSCASLLQLQLNRDEFLDYTGIVQCNSGTTNVLRHGSDSPNQVISSGSQCENGIKTMTTVDSSFKCSKIF